MRRSGTVAVSVNPITSAAPRPDNSVYNHAPSTQVGSAQTSAIMARRRSSRLRNATMRAEFVNIAEMAMMGTTGLAPTSGTSTSGVIAPVPYPATPPAMPEKAARPTISANCRSEMSGISGIVRGIRLDSGVDLTGQFGTLPLQARHPAPHLAVASKHGEQGMDLGIAGRKAIVCASSRGLGRACAKRLRSEE